MKNTKKTEVQSIKEYTIDKDKNNQMHPQIKIHNERLNNINKTKKYKN